jgi:Mn-dependent DtxR family transcriptional regulator
MAELSSYLLQQNRPFNNTNLVDSMAAKLKVGKTAVTKALDALESESLVQVIWINRIRLLLITLCKILRR